MQSYVSNAQQTLGTVPQIWPSDTHFANLHQRKTYSDDDPRPDFDAIVSKELERRKPGISADCTCALCWSSTLACRSSVVIDTYILCTWLCNVLAKHLSMHDRARAIFVRQSCCKVPQMQPGLPTAPRQSRTQISQIRALCAVRIQRRAPHQHT